MSLLGTPIQIGELQLKNRIVMAPMATAFIPGKKSAPGDQGLPDQEGIEHYRLRAQGGVAMMVVEHTYVHPSGKAHRGQLGICDDRAIPDFRHLASEITAGGAAPALQLNHVGSSADPEITGNEVVGPSALAHPRSRTVPRALSEEEIHFIQDEFARAALRARLAGFRGVEIHSAHGYLGSQFLSPLTNVREDDYGGSLENRARFVLGIVSKVRSLVGQTYPVMVRLGCDDGMEGGFTPDDAAQVAAMLEERGVALIDVSGGFIGGRPQDAGPGYFVSAAAKVKSAVNIPVLVAGGITRGQFAESILQGGSADLIGIGRALLQDPTWAKSALIEAEGPL